MAASSYWGKVEWLPWRRCDRQSLRYLLSDSLQKKLAAPWSRVEFSDYSLSLEYFTFFFLSSKVTASKDQDDLENKTACINNSFSRIQLQGQGPEEQKAHCPGPAGSSQVKGIWVNGLSATSLPMTHLLAEMKFKNAFLKSPKKYQRRKTWAHGLGIR